MNEMLKNMGVDLGEQFDFKNKTNNISNYVLYMLSRTQAMFNYEGLPDTIPQRDLERLIQVNGHCCITQVNNKLYALTGGLGGEPNVYYMPTVYTVSNPALNYSKNLIIDTDCVVIPSDSYYLGLLPLFSRYATLMSENDLTMWIADINCRITTLISAGNDSVQKSAEQYIKKIIEGDLSVIADSVFLEGLKTQPYSSTGHSNSITQLIELQQYLKASWYNDLGLNANYNMKRESINSSEAQLNKDSLPPFIDNMLETRQKAITKVNELYGTEISVKLNSAWEKNMRNSNQLESEVNNGGNTTEKYISELDE